MPENVLERRGLRIPILSFATTLMMGATACGGSNLRAPADTSKAASSPTVTPPGEPSRPPFKVPFIVEPDDAPYEPLTPTTLPLLRLSPGDPLPLPKGAEPCQALRKLHDDLISRTFANGLKREHIDSLTEEFKCAPGPHGTWAVLLRRLNVAPEQIESTSSWISYEGVFALVFVRPSGEQVVAEFKGTLGEPEQDWVAALMPVDFDVDGVPEVLLNMAKHTEGSAFMRGSYFFTIRGDTFKRISPKGIGGLGVIDLMDDDEDGVLDVQTYGPYTGVVRDPIERNAEGPYLLLHATPRGFIADDAASQAFAKRFCPTKPAGLDENSIEMSGVCSILWGADVEPIRSRVDEICQRGDPDNLDGKCELGQLVLSWYEHPPFVRLK